MTAITTGAGLGLFNTSLDILGGGGDTQLGRTGERVYVNAATGNLVVQVQDEYLASLGLDLAAVRTYNAQGQFSDDNGDNWRLNISSLYGLTGTVNTAGSTITKVFGDGAEVTYTFDQALGLYVSTAGNGAHDTLRYDSPSAQWLWSDGNRKFEEVFDSAGQLRSARNADGLTTTYSYLNGQVAEISSSNGDTVFFDYLGTNLTQIRTASGGVQQTRTRYGYDALNRLSEVIVDLTPEDGSISDGRTYITRYTYDGTSTRIASITQGDGTRIDFSYEQLNGQWKIKTVSDGEGHASVYSYDAINRETTVTDALGAVTRYRYDLEGRLATIIDALGHSTGYTYDAAGNVTRVTDANDHAVSMAYDASGNLLVKRDTAGNTVTYTYNSANQLVTETVYLVRDPDGEGVGQPGEPRTARYVYDGEQHLRFTVSAAGQVIEHRYDAVGDRVATIAYAAEVYDLAGLAPTDILTEAELNAWAGSQDKTRTERTDYTYDFRGQVSTVATYTSVDSTGNGLGASVTRFVYDPRGLLLQTIDARGTAATDPANPALPYATTYTYDGLGRLVTTTQWVSGGEIRTTVTAYDDLNQRVATTLANGLVTTSVFDRAGRLVSVSQSDSAQSFGTTTYQYDAAGRLRLTTDPTGATSHLLYDAAGRVVATIDGTGSLTQTDYDPAGNAVRQTRYATRLTSAQLALLTDANGHPTNVTLSTISPAAHADDRVSYTLYDQANQVVMQVTPHDTDPAQGHVTQRFYDGAGRVTDVVAYATAVSLANLPGLPTPDDFAPRIVSSVDDRHSRSFYDADGRPVASLDAEGYLTEYQYNAAGALTHTIGYANATTSPTRFTTDGFAELKANIIGQGASSDDRHGYQFYNAKGQLIGVLDAEGYLSEYQYDAVGNRTVELRYYDKAQVYSGTPTLADLRPVNQSARVTARMYNGANQQTWAISLPDNAVTTYAYDAVGNLISTTTAAGTGDARTQQARYDLQGRLIGELSGEGNAALEALLTQNPSASQAEIDALWSSYGLTHTYDSAGKRTSTTDANGHKTLFYYDASGRLTHTVNALGEVSETRYNAFGEVEDTRRYSGRIGTTGLTGGLLTQDLTDRLSAIANAASDSTSHINYTLRGAVRQAIDAENKAIAFTYNAFNQLETETITFDSTTSRVTSYGYDKRGLTIGGYQFGYTGAVGQARFLFSRQYDAFGRVTHEWDSRNNEHAYEYDRLGRTVTVTDPLNQGRHTGYDAFGRVLTQTDARGQITTFSYDDATRRFTVRTPEGISTTTETNAHGETMGITDGNGNTTRYVYDRNGQLTQVTQAEGSLNLATAHTYDHAGLKLTSIDANGTVTRFEYDAANRLVSRTVDPYDAATNPDGLDLTTVYRYDGQGRVVLTVDANGTATVTQYDRNGQVTSITVDPTSYLDTDGTLVTNPNGLNLVTAYTYDAAGHTLTVTEGAGTSEARTTEYRYDALGRRVTEITDPSNSATGYVGLNLTTAYVYDPSDNLVARVEGQGTAAERTTRYVYDANNRRSYAVDAAGGVTHTQYDANGNINATTDYATAIDITGLSQRLSEADITARLAASATDRTTRYAYDRDNRLIYTVNALGYVTEANYDANGNVIARIDYATAIPLTTANTQTAIAEARGLIADPTRDHVSRTVYDAANRATFSLDALNQVIERTYDANGNVIRTTAYATAISLPATVSDSTVRTAVGVIANSAQDRTSRTVYDAANRAVYGIDALGYVTQTHYDLAGRVRETVAYYDAVNLAALGTNPAPADLDTALAARLVTQPEKDQHTAYDYDAAGRLTTTTDAEGYREYYQYDALGNKIAFTNKKGVDAGDPQYTWHYDYDAAGRLIEETTPAVEVTRLTEGADGTITPVTAAEAVVTRMTYDALGNVTGRTEAHGTADERTTEYRYDALGRQIETIYPQVGVYNAAADNLANTGFVQTQSANVIDNAWVRSGTSLVASTGVSIIVDSSLYADATPTAVKATVYRSDGTLVGTTTTDVGYYVQSYSGYTSYYAWNAVSNWSGKVNISTSALPADTYRVTVEIRDDAVGAIGVNAYYDGDATWVRTGTVFVNVGTVNNVVTRTETTTSLSTTTQYDSFGNATVNRDVSGNYSYKVYDALGRVKYEVDTERFVTEYNFDTFGNQISLTRYATALSLAGRADPAAAFTEQEVVALLAQQSATEHAADRTITNSYDRLNRVIETRQPEVYSYDSGSVTNPYFTASPTTRNEYSAFGQLTKQRTLLNTNSSADSGNWTWADVYSTYNARGEKFADVNALGYLTLYEYDARGNVTRQTEYANAWSSQSNPDNRVTEYVYDRLNRKLEEIKIGVEYALPSNSTATPQMVVGNLTTKYAYDKIGNLESVTDASGATTRTYYDALGRSTAVTEPPRLSAGTVGSIQATTLTVENRLVTCISSPSRLAYNYKDKWWLRQYENITVNLPSTVDWGSGQVTVRVDYTLSNGTKASRTFSPATFDAPTASISWYTDQFEAYGYAPNIVSLDWVQVTKAVDGKSVLIFDQSATVTSTPNVILVGKPVIANTRLQLQYRDAGSTSAWTVVPASALLDRGDYYGFDLGALPVGQYEYELTYTLPGETAPYYTGTGRFSVTGTTTTGSVTVAGTVNAANQLVLEGNVANITGIQLVGGATVIATAQANGTYAVDLSGLPRGHYQYRIVRSTGTDSLVSEFDVTASTVAGPAVVQEIFGLTSPNNGFARRIEAANLPVGTASVTLAYRRLGDTGPFISKTSTTIVGGNFAFNYDDVVNGRYEYQLTAKGVDGATLAISAGSSGNFTVKRGAQAIAAQTGGTQNTLIPLSRLDHDIFGNVVHQTRYANGQATTDAFGNPVALASAQDQHGFTYYDSFGHALQTVDGEGNRGYYSYDAAGRVAKSWQVKTDADGVGRFVVKAFGYDGNGRQTSTTEVLSDGALVQSQVVYDAFGNIVNKGTNGDWQEYYQYDNAGRLWRTNQGDGVDKVYLYNLQGQATAEIRSQGRDLSNDAAYPNAGAVVALTSDVVRTDTLYDALGRTVGQVQPSFVSGTTPGSDAATVTVENRLVTSRSTLSRWTYNAGDKWHLVQDEAIYVNLPSTIAWGNGQVTVTVDYTLSNGAKASRTFSPATPDALTASTSWRIDVFEWYGWQPYVASLDWVRVTKVVDGKSVLLFDQAATATSTPNVVLVEKPANSSVEIGLRYRDAGSSAVWTVVPASALLDRGAYYGFNVGALPVGQYEYELSYTLPDETTPYYTGTGRFSVTGTTTTGSATVVGTVNASNQLILQGNVTDLTAIELVGGATLGATAQVNGTYAVDLSSLPRGHYQYRIVRSTGTDSLASEFDVTASTVAGPVVVQEKYASRVLEVANLTGFASVTLKYRHAGDSGAYLTKTSTTIVNGVFTFGYDELAIDDYEYVLADAAGNVLTAAGATGKFTVKRWGQSVAVAQPVTVTPIIEQELDRWGNVLSVTDPRNSNWVTTYRYNYLNQVVEQEQPSVEVVDEHGVSTTQTPTTLYYYNATGRQVGTRDANLHNNNRVYDAAGQLTAEIQADGAVVRYEYDAFGRKTAVVDATGNKSEIFYDRNNHVVQSRNGLAQSEYYAYDELGNRIKVTNGAGETTKYYYDSRGHVIRTLMPELQEHYAAYDIWGHKIRERHYGTTDTVRWTYDYFGRLTDHVDVGGADYDYSYSQTGQLTRQTNTRGQNLVYGYYENGQLKRITDAGTASGNLVANRSETWYEYDAAGHRVREDYAQYNPTTRRYDTYQDAHIAYDALGRMTRYVDTTSEINYAYDAVGNRRHTQATYAGAANPIDYWYLYDAMNRIRVSQGTLANGQIDITATRGVRLEYDGGNNRRKAEYYDSNGALITEFYAYDSAGRFTDTYRFDAQNNPLYTSRRLYDAAGRVGEFRTYSAPGVLSGRTVSTYNKNGWLRTQANYNGAGTWTSTINRSMAGAYAYDGRPLQYQVQTPSYTNTYTSVYRPLEGYREDYVTGGSTYFQSGQTNFVYDVNGNLVKVSDRTDAAKTRTFISNAQGQIVEKTDYQGKHQYYSYANGQAIGSHGDITSADFDFNYTPVSDSYPASSPSSYTVNAGDTLAMVAMAVYGDAKLWYLIADANGLSGTSTLTAGQQLTIPNQITNIHNDYQTFKPYNPGEIIGDTTPNLPDPPPPPKKDKGCGVLGMIIMIVVAIVVTIFTAGAALAALAPAGSAAATAAAAGTWAAGTAALAGGLGWAGVAAAMIGSAVGSIASQLVGMATGNVQEFSWGAVATSALTAGITSGIGVGGVAKNVFGVNPSGLGGTIINGVTNNIVGQGVNMLTGQQKQFNWSSVAISAVGAAASYGIDKAFGLSPTTEMSLGGKTVNVNTVTDGGGFDWSRFGRSVGAELTKSAARQAITIAVNRDGKMNWEQVAADGFGNAIGNAIVSHATKTEQDFIRKRHQENAENYARRFAEDSKRYEELKAKQELSVSDVEFMKRYEYMKQTTIVASIDGTRNDATQTGEDGKPKFDGPTNVYKLHELLDLEDGQGKLYVPGVGTGGSLDQMGGGVAGAGADSKENYAFDWLQKQYADRIEAGIPAEDINIVLIGFSRGAAMIRDLANIINDRGFSWTTNNGEQRSVASPTIRSMIMFDTVASFGLPGNGINIGKNLAIPSNVQNAWHAIADDEFRAFFPLTRIDTSVDGRTEVSYAGSHFDVGAESGLSLMGAWNQLAGSGVPINPLQETWMPPAAYSPSMVHDSRANPIYITDLLSDAVKNIWGGNSTRGEYVAK